MSLIDLEDVILDYPVASPEQLSFKRTLVDRLRGRRSLPSVIRAIDHVSIRLEPGARIGLYGPNGSGKSSLLRLMAGIYPPTEGKVTREGRCTSLLGLGLGANIELSAHDNIVLLLRFEGVEPTAQLVEDIWRFTELDRKFFHLSLRHFSTGMMMRLFFAISTAPHPEILLMDEWLSVVDENFVSKAEERLRSYVGKASIFAIASHNLWLLRGVCKQILFLEGGKVVNTETVEAPAGG
ncbi:MAG: ABC transporter ATP-binding protein [Rhizobiales bacterium]|nr:ABC transporter ATP-binding protein [Hyphomicrobiales bacterium]